MHFSTACVPPWYEVITFLFYCCIIASGVHCDSTRADLVAQNSLSRTVCQQPWPDLADRVKSDPTMFSVLLTRSHSFALLLILLHPSNNRPIILVQVFPPPLEVVTLEESGCAVHTLAWPCCLTHSHTCTDPLRLIMTAVNELGWVLVNVYYTEMMAKLISTWLNTINDVK